MSLDIGVEIYAQIYSITINFMQKGDDAFAYRKPCLF